MAGQSRLPAATRYRDLPPWAHNSDTVEIRTINAGWNALFSLDLSGISFKELAREVGVTPAALYHHFPTIAALGAQLAVSGISSLLFDMAEDLDDEPPTTAAARKALVREVIHKYLLFADKRPRHLALMFSPQFADADKFPLVADQHRRLREAMQHVLAMEIGRLPTLSEVHVFWSLIHGSAALITAGQPPSFGPVLQALERYFEHLRA